MGGEFLEGEFFRGPLLLEKQCQKMRPKNSRPKFGRPKFVSQNSGMNSGSGGAKSPVQTFVTENLSRTIFQEPKPEPSFVAKLY